MMKTVLDWIQILTPLAASLAAILAWVSNLRWSQERLAAKEAEVQSLKTQLELLKSFTSTELLTYLREQIKEFEKQTSTLRDELRVLKEKVQEKDEQIAKLAPNQELNHARIKQLEQEQFADLERIRELESKLNNSRVTETFKTISLIEGDLMENKSVIGAVRGGLTGSITRTVRETATGEGPEVVSVPTTLLNVTPLPVYLNAVVGIGAGIAWIINARKDKNGKDAN